MLRFVFTTAALIAGSFSANLMHASVLLQANVFGGGTTTSTPNSLSVSGACGTATAAASGDGDIFSVSAIANAIDCGSGRLLASASARITETYIATGGAGSGTVALDWSRTCGGNNLTFFLSDAPLVSLSDGSSTFTNIVAGPNNCFSQPASGTVSIPFTFGVTQITITLDTLQWVQTNGLEPFAFRTILGNVRLLDSLGNEISGASLAAVVPEPGTLGALGLGSAVIALLSRRCRRNSSSL